MIGIYCIENIVDGKKYIGQSIDIERRLRDHKYLLNGHRTKNKHLQMAWNKYGQENFKFYILQECSIQKLDELERDYIYKYKTLDMNFGYNIADGGNLGRVIPDATRKIMSQKAKGRKFSIETLLKISLASKGNTHAKGSKRSQEFKDKVSKFQTGRIKTQETRKKISNALKGKSYNSKGIKHSKQSIENMVAGRIKNGGYNHTDETKRKISAKKKGKKPSFKNYQKQLEGIRKYWESKKVTED